MPAPRNQTSSAANGLIARIRALVAAILSADDESVEQAVLQLSGAHRWLAPLSFVVGSVVLLFQGLKLVFSNWRLTLIQLLPAVWIWLAMFDLKLHVLHGRTLRQIEGPILIPLAAAITAVTMLSFYLNAVMAFSIMSAEPGRVRPAVVQANRRLRSILAWGFAIGLALSFATLRAPRWGHPWFALALGSVVGVMMLTYVAVPARLVGVKRQASKRDKLLTSALSGAFGAVICAPPYAISRIGVLMLGTRHLFVPGLFVMTLGVTTQAGATSAVKAIKLSASLLTGGDQLRSDDQLESGNQLQSGDQLTSTDR